MRNVRKQKEGGRDSVRKREKKKILRHTELHSDTKRETRERLRKQERQRKKINKSREEGMQ